MADPVDLWMAENYASGVKLPNAREAHANAAAEWMRRRCIRVMEEWAEEPSALGGPTPAERMRALPLPGKEALDDLLREARRQGAEEMRKASVARIRSVRSEWLASQHAGEALYDVATVIEHLPLPEEAL